MSDANQETHMPPQTLAEGMKTQAFWSRAPAYKLLILVHGFKGSAETTWLGLPQQLLLHAPASGYDLVSFGYDSLALTADESADELHGFMDVLLTKPTAFVNRSIEQYDPGLVRNNSWKYTHLILAGHSLGACVARRALLNQLKAGAHTWDVLKKLIWFAPAHGGARLTHLANAVSMALPFGLGDGLVEAKKYAVPVLIDLERGSDFLKDLLTDTEALSLKHAELNAPVTFWAPGDKVVFNRPFHKDTLPTVRIPGADHQSICKFNGHDTRLQTLLDQMDGFS